PLHEGANAQGPRRTFWMAWAVDYQEFIGASPPAEQWPSLNQYPRSSDRQACRATIKSTHFAVRPGPKISDGEAFEKGICLNDLLSVGSPVWVGGSQTEGGGAFLGC